MGVSEQAVWSTSIELASEHATRKLANALHPAAAPGHTLLLSGEIGAGKTFFARAIIQGLLAPYGTPEDVPSPTFTLVQTYQIPGLEIWHSDLYRLCGIEEVAELGLLDAFETAFCLVEWPDRLGAERPKDALSLTFGMSADKGARRVTLTAHDPKWGWLSSVLGAGLQ